MMDGMTPADIAAVTGGNNAFGGDNGAWWLIVLFLFAFNGWGGGWGGNGGANNGYTLASDFATLQRQIDSATSSLERKGDTINAGLCDGFYAMNTGLLNGFAGVNNAITQNTIAGMQNANALQAQLAQCCCDNKAAIAQVNYNMATQANCLQNAVTSGFCQTNYNASNNTRDIIDSQNANTRAILDALNAQNIAAKDARIAEQERIIGSLQLAASQQAQNAYLIEQLRPVTP